jgi:hypothetical protein
MKYTKTISLVAILALVAGCTPTSDSIVRRVTPAGDDVPTTLPEAVPAGIPFFVTCDESPGGVRADADYACDG